MSNSAGVLWKNLERFGSMADPPEVRIDLFGLAKLPGGMKHLVRAFLTDLGGNPNKRNALNETALHATCQISPNSINGSQDRRAICVQFLLHWRGAILPSGGREKVDLAAQDDVRVP
ncbi:hypothetical protein HUJ05_007271 [Dendroctonus ponderosae]|nr:hypothetical protein HUJ05_007271 [Dendroctonus ponderosae]